MNISIQTNQPSPTPSRWLHWFNTATKKIASQKTDATGVHRPEKKSREILLDPATNRPVARDLRFHHFVAHQREFYLLNQTREQ